MAYLLISALARAVAAPHHWLQGDRGTACWRGWAMGLLVLGGLVLGAGEEALAVAPNWTDRTPSGGPPPSREDAVLADEGNGKVLMFGGYDNGGVARSDTWEFNGTNWTQKNPATVPPARGYLAMATLPNGHVLMFGGGSGSTKFNDTWEWDGVNWNSRTPGTITATNSPSARWEMALTYDPSRNKVVLFGGRTATGATPTDTWEWDIATATWAQVSSTGPGGRTLPGMSYEPNNAGHVLMFGGYSFSSGVYLNDSWEWNGTAWSHLSSSNSPSVRGDVGMCQDANNKVLLFGGQDSSGNVYNDAYEWSGTGWTQVSANGAAGSPIARSDMGMAFCSGTTNKAVMYGGGDPSGNSYSDTWFWNGSWSMVNVASPPNPSARQFEAMVDEGNGKFLLFGGYGINPSGLLNDTWEWNGAAWSQKTPASSPPPREYHAMASEGNGKVLLFGGQNFSGGSAQNGGNLFNDTWEWDSSTGNWTLKDAGGTPGTNRPTTRDGAALATGTGGTVILFGGTDYSGPRNDTWVWNGSTWISKNLATAPPARAYHAMTAEANGKVFLFGGQPSSNYLNDSWELDAAVSSWTQLSPITSPSARSSNALAYDSIRNRVVLFGGQTTAANLNDTWEWDGATWIQMSPATSPTARTSNHAAFDSTLAKVVLFGGVSSTDLNDTWDYYGAPPFISSIALADPTPALSGTVHFTATFSEPVTFSALPSDFVLTAPNLTGGSVTAISIIGSTATVTVNSGRYAGTLRLDVVDQNNIRDLYGNPLLGLTADNYSSGPSYTIYSPPTAYGQQTGVAFNTAGAITLTGTDYNTPPQTLTYTVTTAPTKGSLSGTAPNLTYTPTAGAHGADSFQFTVSNTSGGTSQPATVAVNIAPGTPTVGARAVGVNFNTATAITLTGTDPDANPALSLVFTPGNASHGQITGSSPNFTYTPAADYHGSDSFTYTASNGTNTSQPATVMLVVAPGTPTANGQSVSVSHNSSGTAITLTSSDPDVPAISPTYSIQASPAHGTLSGFNSAAGTVTYTPTADYHGADSFTFAASNGVNTSSAATVTLSVATGTPTANAQSVSTPANTGVNITLTASDADTPSLPLTYSVGTPPQHGLLSGIAPNLTYTPNANYVGPDSFTFTASNGSNSSGSATVSISVLQQVTHFQVVAQSTATAGSSTSVAVTALDANNNTAGSYTGPVHFTSSDGQAVLPMDQLLTSGSGMFAVTFKSKGTQTVNVNDAGTPALTGTSGGVVVSAAAANHFVMTSLSSGTAGAFFNMAVTATDPYGNRDSGYVGTVNFSSDDSGSGVVLPGAHTFPISEGGGWVFMVKLVTAGQRAVVVADTVTPGISGTDHYLVTPAAAVKLAFTAQPGTGTAGTTFPTAPAVATEDAYGNASMVGLGGSVPVTIALSGGTGPLQGAAPADAGTSGETPGQAAFGSLRIDVAGGGKQLTASANGLAAAVSGSFQINPAAVSAFAVSAPSQSLAGSGITVAVAAQDAYANTVGGYAGVVHFTSTDAGATLPADTGLTSGTGSFPVTLITAGSQTVAVRDSVNAALTGTTGNIAVSAAGAASLRVNAAGTATAGTPTAFTVMALDVYQNVASGYAGTVHFTSTDGAAALPVDAGLTSGTGSFAATLTTAGGQVIGAADAASSSISGTSGNIAVSPAAASHFAVSLPGSGTAGAGLSVAVTALDPYQNVATGYGGTVHFTSTDGAAALPVDSGLTAGMGVFSAALKTSGTQTVTATDVVNAAVTGTSGNVVISPAAVSQYAFTAPLSGTSGVAFGFAVTAEDAFGNANPGYSGVVHLTSTDAKAALPGNAALNSGTGAFMATLYSAGAQYLQGVDTVAPGISGSSAGIVVQSGSATQLTVSAPAMATAGTAFTAIFTARDTYGNVAAGDTDTLHFTTTDGAAAAPAGAALSSGTAAVAFTLKTAGKAKITGTDLANSGLMAQSGDIVVGAGAATHFAVSSTGHATVNDPYAFQVAALDAFNNVTSGYAGTVAFHSSDTAATLPGDSTLSSGTGAFSATLETTGTQQITAVDTVDGTVTGTDSVAVEVNQAPTLAAINNPAPVRKNAGEQTVILTGITAGTGETQNLTVTAMSGNTSVIPTPTVSYTSPNTTGTLTYTPVPNATGTSSITVTVQDDGGTAGGGVDTTAQSFAVAVLTINLAPSFVAGPNEVVAQDAGPQTVADWATMISPGAAPDEAGQALNFLVSVDHPEYFTVAPAIAPDGTLTYTPAPTKNGIATVTVRLHDDGGTANGGVDTSAPQSFTITLTTYATQAGTYNGLAQPLVTGTGAGGTPGGNSLSGLLRVTVAKTGLFTGRLRMAGVSHPVRGHFDKSGHAFFGRANTSTLPLTSLAAPGLTLGLNLDVAAGTDKLTGTLAMSGSTVGLINADRALYTASKKAVVPFLNVPAGLAGKYTVVLGAKTPEEQGLPSTAFPQGDGVAKLTLSKSGLATISGYLADGTPIHYTNAVSKLNTWPLYLEVAGGKGSLSTQVSFRNTVQSDLDGANAHWYRPAEAAVTMYKAGWPNGILVDVAGSIFTVPVPANTASVFPVESGTSATGNAVVSLNDGNLPATITESLNIAVNNRVQVINRGTENLSLTIRTPYDGTFIGTFLHPVTGKAVTLHGVIFQKQQLGVGFFLGQSEGGSVVVGPP